MLKNKHEVVMLSTKSASIAIVNGKFMSRSAMHNFTESSYYKPQHLYIISDKEIKEGDWFLSDDRNTKNEAPIYRVEQCIKIEGGWIFGNIDGIGAGHNPDWSKKIVASTDKSLEINRISTTDNIGFETIRFTRGIPQINEAFQLKYIERYNAGKPITKVNVEYEELLSKSMDKDKFPNIVRLKLRSDNTVIISSIQDVFTRDEVLSILNTYNEKIEDFGPFVEDYVSMDDEEREKNGLMKIINHL